MPSTDTRAALVEKCAEELRDFKYGEGNLYWHAERLADLLAARSAPVERGEGRVADLLLDFLSDWSSNFERGLLIVNIGEEEGPFPRTIQGGPGVGDTLCVGPNENARDALLDAALHDGSDDFKRELQAALASLPAPVEGTRERMVEEVTQVAFSAYTMGAAANEPDDVVVSLRRVARECADRILAAHPVQGAGGGEREERRRSTAFYLWNLAQGSRNIAHYLPDALAHLHTFEQMAVLPLLSEERDLLVRVACGIADNAPWRQSPDMDILKSVVQEYRAASPAPSAPEEEP